MTEKLICPYCIGGMTQVPETDIEKHLEFHVTEPEHRMFEGWRQIAIESLKQGWLEKYD
jgi:hypothetical protein